MVAGRSDAGIGVGDRAADRATVTDLGVADLAGGVRQQRHVLLQERRRLDVHVAGQGADGDVVAAVADVRQVAEATDVDQHGRLGEAELHHRQQAVAAGDELGLVAVLADEADRLLRRLGADVVECCRDHGLPPGVAAVDELRIGVTPTRRRGPT